MIKNKFNMEAVLIQPNNKADMRLLINFSKRMGALTKIMNEEELEELEDAALLKLMEQSHCGDGNESVSLDEVLKILRQ
jgi:hypothetical protein